MVLGQAGLYATHAQTGTPTKEECFSHNLLRATILMETKSIGVCPLSQAWHPAANAGIGPDRPTSVGQWVWKLLAPLDGPNTSERS